jgi:hypothetical protein
MSLIWMFLVAINEASRLSFLRNQSFYARDYISSSASNTQFFTLQGCPSSQPKLELRLSQVL